MTLDDLFGILANELDETPLNVAKRFRHWKCRGVLAIGGESVLVDAGNEVLKVPLAQHEFGLGYELDLTSLEYEARILEVCKAVRGVVSPVAFVEDEKLPLLVLPRLGSSIDDRVETRGDIDAATALAVIRDVGGALAEMHALGMHHNDVTPTNILDQPQGRWVLIDPSSPETVGTPGYSERRTDCAALKEVLLRALDVDDPLALFDEELGELIEEIDANRLAAVSYSASELLRSRC